jgi:3-methylcrotonyl-CoA carboxylase alpha subunit
MIAKLIVYGEDRPAAIARLQQTLARSAIAGVITNSSLLQTISNHHAFQAGHTHTSFLEEYALLQTPDREEDLPSEVLLAAAWNDVQREMRAAGSSGDQHSGTKSTSTYNPWQILGPWRMIGATVVCTYHFHDQDYKIFIKKSAMHVQNGWSMQINDGLEEEVTCSAGEDGLILLSYGTRQERAYVQRQQDMTLVIVHGRTYALQRRRAPDVESAAHGGSTISTQRLLKAPMTGTIVKIQVRDGELVQAHQILVIVSAMKMEHAISAPYEGRVGHVYYQEGAVVSGGATLVEME